MNKRVHITTLPVCASFDESRELRYALQKVERFYGNDYCRIRARRVRSSKWLMQNAWHNYAFSGEPRE